ncbi:MAG TPA: PEP/pyruvate-binding domain-containing protein, partial [Polyangiaceae bacterium]
MDRTQGALVGGKGANLAALARIDGVRVPPGFCITTDAFAQVVSDELLAPLVDRESAVIRAAIEAAPIPAEITDAIAKAVHAIGDDVPCAVRSSATAEDLPNASFAGQQDTYLNVTGAEAILAHVRKCWASLFTDRAVVYRSRNRISHREVKMAVVVQEMVPADAAGVLFTADPVSSNRKVATIEAVTGLGEALVSGHVTPETITVREARIERKSGASAVLTDAQILELERVGRTIEAHFGSPQDVEWCFAKGALSIVQARPITTVFPLPPIDDEENHLYLSVGHQQMMTDAMRPLGLSFWQMTTPKPMKEAGGRLFVDATDMLSGAAARASLLTLLGKSDPLYRDAVQSILERGFIPLRSDEGEPPPHRATGLPPVDPDRALVADFVARTSASIAVAAKEIETKSGLALFDFIREDIVELRRLLTDPKSLQVVMTGIEGVWWLNEMLEKWLGEKNAGDALTQSVPDNVTSEMGLALLDVADA